MHTRYPPAFRRSPILIAPGVYDALTALIAERAGFEALYVSGAGIAYTRLGRPDIGLVGMSEVVQTVTLIRDRVGAPSHCRRRYRLWQCAQCAAHRAPSGTRRRQCDPDRGSGFSQTLRPSRRQGAGPGGRNGRQDQSGGGCARVVRDADHRPHRRRRGRRLRPCLGARGSSIGKRAPTCCSSKRRASATNSAASPSGSAKAVQIRAADGEHGGGRQDADAAGRRA